MAKRKAIAIGDRVEVEVTIDRNVGRPAFGRVVALDQVAVIVEGEVDARAFAVSQIKRVEQAK